MGELTGARFIVSGSFNVENGRIRLNAHLIEVHSSRIARSATSVGEVDKLLELVEQLAGKLAEAPVRPLAGASPGKAEARPLARLYLARGLGRYHAGMHELACTEFMKSGLLDPDDDRPRFWLARSYRDGKDLPHAIVEFERFLKDFPDSRLAPRARKLLAECKAIAIPTAGPAGDAP